MTVCGVEGDISLQYLASVNKAEFTHFLLVVSYLDSCHIAAYLLHAVHPINLVDG